MLGALGGLGVVALVLNRNEAKASVILTYLIAAFVMWLHAYGGTLV